MEICARRPTLWVIIGIRMLKPWLKVGFLAKIIGALQIGFNSIPARAHNVYNMSKGCESNGLRYFEPK